MSEPGRAPIPKFGSFNRRRQAATREDSTHDRQASARRDGRRRKGSRDREKASRRYDDHIGVVASEREDSSPPKLQHASPSVDVRTDDFFIVDRRGDSKNLEYGSVHRYDVPSYYRIGCGRVLGASNLHLQQDKTAREAVLVSDDHERKFSDRPLASKRTRVPRTEFRVIPLPGTDSLWDLDSDEISFRSNDRNTLGSEPSAAWDLVDYRSIEGKAKESEQPEDEDLELVSEPVNNFGGSASEARVRQEHALLSRKIKQNPVDLPSWICLIEHQSEVLFHGRDQSSLTTSERRALADIRLSLYHQAEKHFSTKSTEKEILLLGIMAEREAVLESAQLAKKWLDILREYPTSIKLWMKYLDHSQGSHYDFKFETCKARYIQCMQIISDAGRQASDLTQLLANQVYLISRLTAFIRDAGYTELATGIWQAVLELCFSANNGTPATDSVLTELESFWESDVARIGEDGSLGFANFLKDKRAPSRTALSQMDEGTDKPLLRQWAERESRLAVDTFLPATATQDEDDPFRFVMFTDIKDLISPLLPGMSIEVLVSAFLVHHCLPPLNIPGNLCRDWPLDEYLVQATTRIEHRPVSLRWLFSTAFDDFKTTHNGPISESHLVRFIDRVLDRLCTNMPAREAFSEFYIAFKMHVLPQELNRAKKLIKARPRSLKLYNAYALAEAGLGRLEKAREVWRLASGMTVDCKDVASQEEHLQNLYCSWIQTEMSANHESGILGVFARMIASTDVREGGMNTILRLRVSEFLQHQWANAIDQKRYMFAASVAECMACFQYITEDHNLEAVMNRIRLRSAALPQDGALEELELLHEAKVRILGYHLNCHRAYQPALARRELRESLKLYPNNTLFLRTYADHESRFDLRDRIRAPLRHELTNERSSTVVTLAFAMDQELDRYAGGAGGASEHSVRNLFVRMLLQPSPVRHSFAMWRKWFLFEHPGRLDTAIGHTSGAQQERMMGKAKQVFLDGLRNLPWHKGWAMLGMGSEWGVGGMTEGELRQIYDILFERELRVRIEVE